MFHKKQIYPKKLTNYLFCEYHIFCINNFEKRIKLKNTEYWKSLSQFQFSLPSSNILIRLLVSQDKSLAKEQCVLLFNSFIYIYNFYHSFYVRHATYKTKNDLKCSKLKSKQCCEVAPQSWCVKQANGKLFSIVFVMIIILK